MILFVIGIKDDIISLTPSKKFTAQIIAAIITVYFADIRLHSLHGIMGIHVLPPAYSMAFSIVGCIFVTNAFNLIDGIDGLAGSISILCAATLGISLAFQGNYNGAFMAFALMGSIIGFLRYNLAPAKIFMGDSGSLFIGFTISVLCIIFINSYSPTHLLAKFIHTPKSALIVALSILFIPVFDSFRVFVTRIAKGHHPFKADRSHLHHYLLDLGFSHSRTVTTLLTANLLIIAVSLLVQDYNPNIAIGAILALTFGLFGILYYMRKARLAKTEVIKTGFSPSNGHVYREVKKVGGKTVALEPSIHSIAQEGS
jgi:UDP-N-acetylmuramyl pentapeptide phosphotransferase/UDP-N-acetylglucosamine-1-phosphate transferase